MAEIGIGRGCRFSLRWLRDGNEHYLKYDISVQHFHEWHGSGSDHIYGFVLPPEIEIQNQGAEPAETFHHRNRSIPAFLDRVLDFAVHCNRRTRASLVFFLLEKILHGRLALVSPNHVKLLLFAGSTIRVGNTCNVHSAEHAHAICPG